ncbi:MAG: hypothetical protein ACOH2H_14120 [Cypionkella sp.]
MPLRIYCAQVDASGGKNTEAFVVGEKGLNAVVSSAASDMWQGDEDEFSKVFLNGTEGTFFGDVELNGSTQTYQGQISVSITDSAPKETIGTMIVGVNADAL